jgi:hypothetical protein
MCLGIVSNANLLAQLFNLVKLCLLFFSLEFTLQPQRINFALVFFEDVAPFVFFSL